MEECGTTLRLRGFEAPEEDVAREVEAREEWMKAVDGGGAGAGGETGAREYVARWHSPSSAEPTMDAEEAARNMTVEKLPGENPFTEKIETDQPHMLAIDVRGLHPLLTKLLNHTFCLGRIDAPTLVVGRNLHRYQFVSLSSCAAGVAKDCPFDPDHSTL